MSPVSHTAFRHVSYLWDPARVPADPVGQLLVRSNWLGADLRLTNYAGGNTSVKCTERDPLTGEPAEVLWVKGSGGDLGTLARDGLAALYLARFFALEKLYRGPAHEDEMVAYLPHCTFNLAKAAASIDTPLHAFIPRAHVDHLHPDAVIAIAASRDGAQLTAEVYGGKVAWLPWQRPGFALGLALRACYQAQPGLQGIVLGGHGLFAWGDTARECYETTLGLVEQAAEFIVKRAQGRAAFGGPVRTSLAPGERRAQAARIAPVLRGLAGSVRPVLGHFRDDAPVQEFLESKDLARLAEAGTSCPDHFLRTKRQPLLLDLPADADPLSAATKARLKPQFDAYRAGYAAYYERHKRADSPPLRAADPAVVLWPGVGLFAFARDKPGARVAAEFYVNAINVMRGAETLSRYAPIASQEAFDVEYWALEEAKLRRMPPEPPLARRVALVTGAGSGIGKAIAWRLAREGACVAVADLDLARAQEVAAEIARACPERALALCCDVSSESAVAAAFRETALAFGAVDLVVNNAGLSISKPLTETTERDWDLQYAVMAKGGFLVSREAARTFAALGQGGDIIYIASKNALAAQPNNIAYGTAKASQLHQVRLLAAELGPQGIRVNAVNPDAVVRGSGIFAGGWGADRAKTYGIKEEDLPKFYAQRTLLNQEILPEDIANAVFALVGGELKKSTGLIVAVDGGVTAAFAR